MVCLPATGDTLQDCSVDCDDAQLHLLLVHWNALLGTHRIGLYAGDGQLPGWDVRII